MVQKKKAVKQSNGGAKNAPLVAVYGIDMEGERGQMLRRVVKELGFLLRSVAPEQLNNPVGYVAGLVGYRSALQPFAGEAPTCEFLLMCNLNSKQMDDFLLALKATGANIERKAVLTKFNKDWTFAQLVGEVSQEHETLAAIERDKIARA